MNIDTGEIVQPQQIAEETKTPQHEVEKMLAALGFVEVPDRFARRVAKNSKKVSRLKRRIDLENIGRRDREFSDWVQQQRVARNRAEQKIKTRRAMAKASRRRNRRG